MSVAADNDASSLAAFPWLVEVSSGSMSPGIPRGAVVRIEPLSGRPASGEVVLIESPSGYTLHRVIGVSRDGLVVHQGDLAGTRAGLVPEAAIRGRAVSARRRTDAPWDALPPFPSPARWKWRAGKARAYLITRWLGRLLLTNVWWRARLSAPLRRWLL